MNIYYVYGLFAENICFYVGKGKGDRKLDHFRDFKNHNKAVNPSLYYKLQSLFQKNIIPYIKVFFENLSENEALEQEKNLIRLYKKKRDGGTLCNLSDGGTQPLSYAELLKVKGQEEMIKIKNKQKITFSNTIYKRNKDKIEQLKLLLSKNMMIKDIAIILKITTCTIRTWCKKYNITMNYAGKQERIRNHLHELRQINRQNVPKTAKVYTISQPDGSTVVINKLVLFCKQHNLDYANLRRTFKGNAKHHKGYSIIDQQNPSI